MVYFIEGVRHPGHRPRAGTDGEYRRQSTVFRVPDLEEKADELSTAMSSAASSANGGGGKPIFHLVVSTACGWSQRASAMRIACGLQDDVTLSVVDPVRDDDVGWTFRDGGEKINSDDEDCFPYGANGIGNDSTSCNITGIEESKALSDCYLKSDPLYTGNITTPVLFDSRTMKIVSNDSKDIVRMFAMIGSAKKAAHVPDYYPKDIRDEIDQVSERIQQGCNNGVYRAGLARSQSAYDSAVRDVFEVLDGLEDQLSRSRYLLGSDRPTVADFQLVPTLLRFDLVYHPLFKCSTRRLKSYRHLSNYVRDHYQSVPGVRETSNFAAIACHYYTTFDSVNPNRRIPYGSAEAHEKWMNMAHDRNLQGRWHMTHREPLVGTKHKSSSAEATDQDQTDAEARRAKGEYVRGVSGHRNWIVDGSKHPHADFVAETGRYHLFVANNCPWCHRVALGRSVLGLQDHVSMDVLFYRRDPDRGWQYLPSDEHLRDHEKANPALLEGISLEGSLGYGTKYVKEIYEREGSSEKSVPVLYDKKRKVIVSNESSEILRMFETVLAPILVGDAAPDLYPAHLSGQIEALNSRIYQNINNGAYRAGFTSNQKSHDEAFKAYFETLGEVDRRLAESKFLLGDSMTEADLRLFPTVVRHDAVYYSRMKLSKLMIADLPNLSRWLRSMYNVPGVRDATRLDHCIHGYFGRTGTQIIPAPADLDEEWY